MDVIIRQETSSDYTIVERLVEEAFLLAEHAEHTEHLLVARLRKSAAFIPELSLVAESDGVIVGHILFTQIDIVQDDTRHSSLALAPVSVLPAYQCKGIGARLVRCGLDKAFDLGYASVVVLGHKDYYPRFGFVHADQYRITAPFDAPSECYFVCLREPNALRDISGVVEYAKEFFEE